MLAPVAGITVGLWTLSPKDFLTPVIVSAVPIGVGAFMDPRASNP